MTCKIDLKRSNTVGIFEHHASGATGDFEWGQIGTRAVGLNPLRAALERLARENGLLCHRTKQPVPADHHAYPTRWLRRSHGPGLTRSHRWLLPLEPLPSRRCRTKQSSGRLRWMVRPPPQ
jgi:hypothetical protein